MLVMITGMPLAGKTAVSNVARRLGIPVVSMGDVIRREARRRGIAPSPENFRRLMVVLRREMGGDAVARLCSRDVEEHFRKGHRLVVVEGVRSLEELEFFKSLYRVSILAVHASPRTRFERAKRRGRADDPKTPEEFMARDMLELRIGVGSVIALADYMLVNEYTLEELERRAEEIFVEVLRSAEGYGQS